MFIDKNGEVTGSVVRSALPGAEPREGSHANASDDFSVDRLFAAVDEETPDEVAPEPVVEEKTPAPKAEPEPVKPEPAKKAAPVKATPLKSALDTKG